MSGDWLVIEGLERLVSCGRSSRWGFRRRLIMERHKPSPLPKEPAARARALRLRGDEAGARKLLAGRRDAASLAAFWELGGDPSLLDEAVRLEPRNLTWRAWRALSYLLERPGSDYGLAPNGINRRAKTPEARRLARAALAETPDTELGRVVCALAFDDLGEERSALAALAKSGEGWQRAWKSDLRRRAGDLKGFAAEAEASLLKEENAAVFRFCLSPRAGNAALAKAKAARWWERAARAEARRSPEAGDYEGSLEDLRAVAEARPRSAWAWAYLARALAPSGGGAAELARARKLAPRCGWIAAWDAKRSGGDWDEVIALDPDYELSYAWSGGLENLELACELDPEQAWAQRELSRARRAAGLDWLTPLSRACELDTKFADRLAPDEEKALAARLPLWRGVRLLRAGQAAKALPLLSGAWRGEALLALGRVEEAAPLLDRGSARAAAALGVALGEQGRKKEALAALGRALSLEPGYWQARLARLALRWSDQDWQALRALAREPGVAALTKRVTGRILQ